MSSASPAEGVDDAPLTKAERREIFLDVAAELVSSGRIDELSMESVAERAGVSRPLVYKHFANRQELLAAVYRRESASLNVTIRGQVGRAHSLEDKLRALIESALSAQATRGATFAALATNGLDSPAELDVRRSDHRETLQHFTKVAMSEIGLDRPTADMAMTVALSTILIVLNEFRRRPTPGHAAQLADVYVSMTMGGLRALAQKSARRPARRPKTA